MIKQRRAIIDAAQTLLTKGLIAGSWGNISVRTNLDNILITPSGRDYYTLRDNDIVAVGIDGTAVAPNQLEPSSEMPLHLRIYNARPDVLAIVHTHSIFATACAAARQSIPAIVEDLVQIVGGEVAVADYAAPGSNELAINTSAALGNKFAVLLSNHGVIAAGKTLREAVITAELVERTAQIFCCTKLLGGAAILSEAEIAGMHHFYGEVYRRRQGG